MNHSFWPGSSGTKLDARSRVHVGELTWLQMLMSTPFFRQSKAFSRFPARAARRQQAFTSVCGETKKGNRKVRHRSHDGKTQRAYEKGHCRYTENPVKAWWSVKTDRTQEPKIPNVIKKLQSMSKIIKPSLLLSGKKKRGTIWKQQLHISNNPELLPGYLLFWKHDTILQHQSEAVIYV